MSFVHLIAIGDSVGVPDRRQDQADVNIDDLPQLGFAILRSQIELHGALHD